MKDNINTVREDLVSVILVNWNGLKWLEKCIDSLLAQTYERVEVILVDNGSTDNSVAYVESKYPTVVIHKTGENLGFAGGVNAGVAVSNGDYIMLLNTDAWVDKHLIGKLKADLLERKQDVVGPYEAKYDTTSKGTYTTLIDLFGHPVNIYGLDGESFFMSGVCLLFTKKLFIETGRLDSEFFMYCEEVDWFWRLRLLGKKISFAKSCLVYHAGNGSTPGRINKKIFLWRNQNTLQMILKNYQLKNLLWILPVYIVINIFEIIFFLVLNPSISMSYIEGWLFNIKHLSRILQKRKLIQSMRKVDDKQIISQMYHGFGKIYHIRQRVLMMRKY